MPGGGHGSWFEAGDMSFCRWRLLLLLVALGCSSSSSSHSLCFFYTVVSEPSQGLPQFISVGLVNDQPITRYDSNIRRKVPRAPWMEKVEEYEVGFWERETHKLQRNELVLKARLVMLRDRFNQQNSTGLHTLQKMYGCEVGPDGRLSGGNMQFAYDGEDFIALDTETVTWTARVPQAQETKRRWEIDIPYAQSAKEYLEEECVEWLRRCLDCGKETLQRTERPTARVARKKGHDGRETLFCRLYGFFPKEIEVTWMKDGEDRRPETWTGGVVPNSDGTYNTWMSIDVDPKDRDRYRCRVGHDSLLEPLDLAWEEPASNLGLVLGIVGGALLAVAILVGAIVFLRKQKQKGYRAASRSDQGSDSSTRVSVPEA